MRYNGPSLVVLVYLKHFNITFTWQAYLQQTQELVLLETIMLQTLGMYFCRVLFCVCSSLQYSKSSLNVINRFCDSK